MQKLPIVILHGWNLSGEKYQTLVDLLKKRKFTVYAPDLPGFGKNQINDKILNLSDYVTFVNLYLDKHSIKKVILLGHSFGGRVAIKFTAKYPDKVANLILAGVPGFLPVTRAKVVFFLALSKIGKRIFRFPLFCSFEKRARNFLYKAAHASDYQRAEGVMRETFKNIIKEDLISPMKQINCPTLLIWGEQDRTVPKTVAYKMKQVIKGSKLIIIADVAHRLAFEQPEKIIKAIHTYLT